MSLLAPITGELFTLRVFKETDVSPTQVWSNAWEVQAQGATSLADLNEFAAAVVAFERGMSQDTVRFNRYVLSTWVPDGEPYDPETFTSQPLEGLGTVSSPPDAETLPLNVVLFVKREVATGRYGKLFLRRALDETEVSGRYGDWRIDPSALAVIETRVTTLLASSGLGDYLAGGETGLRLVMAAVPSGGGAVVTRAVTDLTPAGCRTVRWNNRYYDVP